MLSSRHVLAAAALTMAIGFAPPAAAQARVQVGVLDCRAVSGTAFIVGSVREFHCLYRPVRGTRERYVATVQRVGLDLGFAPNVVMGWAVFAPSRGLPRGALAGSYGGISAEATLGVGLGANALLGGSRNTIALQPITVGAQTGLNIAAGVAGMVLRRW